MPQNNGKILFGYLICCTLSNRRCMSHYNLRVEHYWKICVLMAINWPFQVKAMDLLLWLAVAAFSRLFYPCRRSPPLLRKFNWFPPKSYWVAAKCYIEFFRTAHIDVLWNKQKKLVCFSSAINPQFLCKVKINKSLYIVYDTRHGTMLLENSQFSANLR